MEIVNLIGETLDYGFLVSDSTVENGLCYVNLVTQSCRNHFKLVVTNAVKKI